MFRKFLADERGNYMLVTAAALVPIMGGLAVAVDYAEMSRQQQITLNALDAAGIATARRIVQGGTEAEFRKYADEFFRANLGSVDPSKTTLHVTLPTSDTGGGTLKMRAELEYDPYFLPAFRSMISSSNPGTDLHFSASNEIRLKNTLEVALVLDNSGSMDANGSGSGKKRLVLLKEAATQLVDTIAAQASQVKQVEKPVQFGIVPFSSSVNVGTHNATAGWMDRDGVSPIHHENFDWSTMSSGNKRVQQIGGIWYKKGSDWGAQENQKVTRFSMFEDLRRQTGTQWESNWVYKCTKTNWKGSCTEWGWVDEGKNVPVYGPYASWAGCVETRPHPFAYDTTAPTSTNPATFFVPMFAPDETDRQDGSKRWAMGNWWADQLGGSNDKARQRYMPKYFEPAPLGTAAVGAYEGPNAMCSTTPILPLTDVSTTAGLNTVKKAINDMVALGATDIPEGTAWGWRVINSKAPFTEARPESEKGNDKVVIVLTDGFNTYYTPNSLSYNDLADNKSIYSNKGYTGQNYNGGSNTRLYMNTSVNKGTFTNANYTSAMNQHMDSVCAQMKASGIIVMTVTLDLSTSKSDEKAAIDMMRACASDSRFRRDESDPGKAAKLFWNTTGGNLAETFKQIADELSNLRIVG